jgi:hypothetical protein
MEKRSKHYGDVSNWIEKVIKSCITEEHIQSTRNLLNNFESQYVNLDHHLIHHMVGNPLRRKLDQKHYEILDEKISQIK